MRTTKAISVTLTHRMADMVREKVASGEYATESEVVRDGLRMLEERDAAMEEWFRHVGQRRDNAYRLNPERGKDAAETWAEIEKHMDSTIKRRA